MVVDAPVVELELVLPLLFGEVVVVVAGAAVVVVVTLASWLAEAGLGNAAPLGTNPIVMSSSFEVIATFAGLPVYIFGWVSRIELHTDVSNWVGFPLQLAPWLIVPFPG